MGNVIAVTLPVFGLILAGWGSTFLRVLDPSTGRVLAAFVYWVPIPCLLIRALSRTSLPDGLPLIGVAPYLIAISILFALSMAVARLRGERAGDKLAILGFSAAFGNTLLMGTAIILHAFGEAATLPFLMLMSFDSLLLFTAVIVVAEIGRGGAARLAALPGLVLHRLGSNPVLMALIIGGLMAIAGIRLPPVLDRFAELMSGAAVPCALFATGAALRSYRLRPAMGAAIILTAMKLLLLPTVVWLLAAKVFALPPIWVAVSVLVAGMPIGVNAYIFASRYETGQAEAAAGILLSTLLSLLTLTILVGLLQSP